MMGGRPRWLSTAEAAGRYSGHLSATVRGLGEAQNLNCLAAATPCGLSRTSGSNPRGAPMGEPVGTSNCTDLQRFGGAVGSGCFPTHWATSRSRAHWTSNLNTAVAGLALYSCAFGTATDISCAIQSIDSGRARVKIPGAFLHRHLGTYVKNALVYAGLQYFGDILGCQSCIARKDDWLTRQQFSYVHRSLLLWADKPASWTAATLEYCLQGRCEQSGSDRWRVVPPTGLRDGSLQIGPDPLIVHVPLPGPLPERTAVMTGGTLRLEHHDVARGDGVVYLFDVHPMRLVLTPLDVWRPSDVSEASTREYRLP